MTGQSGAIVSTDAYASGIRGGYKNIQVVGRMHKEREEQSTAMTVISSFQIRYLPDISDILDGKKTEWGSRNLFRWKPRGGGHWQRLGGGDIRVRKARVVSQTMGIKFRLSPFLILGLSAEKAQLNFAGKVAIEC